MDSIQGQCNDAVRWTDFTTLTELYKPATEAGKRLPMYELADLHFSCQVARELAELEPQAQSAAAWNFEWSKGHFRLDNALLGKGYCAGVGRIFSKASLVEVNGATLKNVT